MRSTPLHRPSLRCAALLGLALFASACTVRETTTPRTATEVLLLTTAAERAVKRYEAKPLCGKRVAIDASLYVGVEKNFLISALRTRLVRQGVRLVKDLRATKPEAPAPEVIIELRNATLGLWDGDFTLGIPDFQLGSEGGFDPATIPGLYLVRRNSQQGFCKLQLFVYNAADVSTADTPDDLWGHTYYNSWFVLGFGPFLGDEDIYPERDALGGQLTEDAQ